MTEIEPVEAPLGLQKQIETVEKVGIYHLKGYRNSEIAELLGLRPGDIKKYIQEYLSIVQNQVEANPYFMEQVQLNTMKALKELDEIGKEAWETVEIATQNGMVSTRVQSLKLALEILSKKTQLLQLVGGSQQKNDSDYLVRMQKVETVNQMLSRVLKDIVSDCDKCRERARVLLAEAFAMMEADEAEIVENENNNV